MTQTLSLGCIWPNNGHGGSWVAIYKLAAPCSAQLKEHMLLLQKHPQHILHSLTESARGLSGSCASTSRKDSKFNLATVASATSYPDVVATAVVFKRLTSSESSHIISISSTVTVCFFPEFMCGVACTCR